MYLRLTIVAISAALLGLPALFNAGPASAHEHRAVGNYEFVVGWLNEPALVSEPNGLSLRITLFPNGVPEEESEEAEAEGQPVEGLEETLQAEIIAGGGAQTMELTLDPAFRDPGHYESVIFPSVVGDYSFHIFGDLEGTAIDETFSSGPETFSSIEDVTEVQFPEKLPSNAELKASIDGVSAQVAALDSSGGGGDDSSDTALIVAIVGVIAGVLGLAVGGYAVSRRS